MKIKTNTHLLFDSSDERCKFVIANDRATVVCLDTGPKKPIKNEYWLPLTSNDPYSFSWLLESKGLEGTILRIMEVGAKSNDY